MHDLVVDVNVLKSSNHDWLVMSVPIDPATRRFDIHVIGEVLELVVGLADPHIVASEYRVALEAAIAVNEVEEA